MPWFHMTQDPQFDGSYPRGAQPGYICEVVLAGHLDCGCMRSKRRMVFFPHPPASGRWPMHYLAMEALVAMYLPPRHVVVNTLSYGWVWQGSLGEPLE